jgi:pyruvate dehydrogenase E2 component (dihydrolipoamide acetyltransferase)
MNVLMPQLGETVAEGKIVKWFKAAGDSVKPGDNLFEIETDKTSMEVPSTVAGTLTAINVGVGEVAKVGAVVAVIGGAADASTGGTTSSPLPHSPSKTGVNTLVAERDSVRGNGPLDGPVTPSPRPSPPRGEGDHGAMQHSRPFAYPNMHPFREVRTPEKNYGPARIGGRQVTPLARRLAGERGIDLATVTGSGPHGRIVAGDVEKAAPPRAAAAAGPSAAEIKALFDGVAYEEVPLDSMRAAVARRMAEAKSTVPHFYLTADIETGRLLAMREEANRHAPAEKDGTPSFHLSLNDFIIKMWAMALQRVPQANAVWAEDRILRFRSSDIGVAVALDGGLITPVVRNAETKSVSTISGEVKDFAERARNKTLRPDEYRGGASAISNLGMYGVREFAAIVNPPQATILAVGASRRAPAEAADGSVHFVDMMTVTLSCDYRVVDGALGAQLLAAFKQFVENPVTALV